ncbi:Zinc finger C2H2-type, partial [Trinorchestia longiramus]
TAKPGGPRSGGLLPTYYGPFLPFEALDLSSLLTDEKLYHCPGCPRRFGFKSEFKIHYMIHSGEKPFRCYLCSYGTNQKSHLKRHVEQRH